MSKIGKELEATSGKLQEIHESVNKRISGVEERTVDAKVDNLEKAFDVKLVMMEEEINNLHR